MSLTAYVYMYSCKTISVKDDFVITTNKLCKYNKKCLITLLSPFARFEYKGEKGQGYLSLINLRVLYEFVSISYSGEVRGGVGIVPWYALLSSCSCL